MTRVANLRYLDRVWNLCPEETGALTPACVIGVYDCYDAPGYVLVTYQNDLRESARRVKLPADRLVAVTK